MVVIVFEISVFTFSTAATTVDCILVKASVSILLSLAAMVETADATVSATDVNWVLSVRSTTAVASPPSRAATFSCTKVDTAFNDSLNESSADTPDAFAAADKEVTTAATCWLVVSIAAASVASAPSANGSNDSRSTSPVIPKAS